eukprot:scaffold1192_cov80-Skeletonema_marinoi.AAC.2
MSVDNTEADDTMWCLALVSSIAVLFLSLVLQRRFALPAASSAISLFLQTADMLRKSTTKKVASSCCAACGIAEVDDITLKECATCDLVRYCSDTCQKNHWPQHKEACKKRAAELRDELLFKQPESSHLGDCPICCIPFHLDESKSSLYSCCSKLVCRGCSHANNIREVVERGWTKCPFCRQPLPTEEESEKYSMKRVEANDPYAIHRKGAEQYKKGHYQSAFECFTRAAELGDVEAHFKLALLYHNGRGVEKDEKRAMHHLKEAAIGGHPRARYNLGCVEWNNGKTERAVNHWIIAATQGEDDSIKFLLEKFRSGIVSKDDLAAALRAHQAAVDSAKSPQREAAETASKAAEEYLRSQKMIQSNFSWRNFGAE